MQYLVRLSSFFCSSMIKESALADHISQLVWVMQCSRSVQPFSAHLEHCKEEVKNRSIQAIRVSITFHSYSPKISWYELQRSRSVILVSTTELIVFQYIIQEWIMRMTRLILPPLPIPESAYLITWLTPPPPTSIPICFPCRYLHKNQLTSLHYRHFHFLDQLTYL